MQVAFFVLTLLVILYGPSLWVGSVIKHYHREQNYPGTGAQFARHLLNRLSLEQVLVEMTNQGDHYDPIAKAVRLSKLCFEGKSLSAITIAAHEVGHAIQDASNMPLFRWRTRLALLAFHAERMGSVVMLLVPVITLLTRTPASGLLTFLLGAAIMGSASLVHLVTLPVEMDASFQRALPLLEAGGYLKPQHSQAAHRILRAAAFTYLAASLSSLLNLGRWWALWRR